MQSHMRYHGPDKPTRAYGTRLVKGRKPEVFRGATETFDDAKERANKTPKEIIRLMEKIRGRMNGDYGDKISPIETLKQTERVRRLVGGSIQAHVEYANTLIEIQDIESRLKK